MYGLKGNAITLSQLSSKKEQANNLGDFNAEENRRTPNSANAGSMKRAKIMTMSVAKAGYPGIDEFEQKDHYHLLKYFASQRLEKKKATHSFRMN